MREKGVYNFSGNLEVKKQAPLDARNVVSDLNSLTSSETWVDSEGGTWLYNGLVVYVEENKRLYVLVDKNNYEYRSGWLEIIQSQENNYNVQEFGGFLNNCKRKDGSAVVEFNPKNIFYSRNNKCWVCATPSLGGPDSIIESEDEYIDSPLIPTNNTEGFSNFKGIEYYADSHLIPLKNKFYYYNSKLYYFNGEDLVSLTTKLNYNTSTKRIELLDVNNTPISSIDANNFIKDGMVDTVKVVNNPESQSPGKYLEITFNTDAGKEPIYISTTDLGALNWHEEN